MLSDSQGIEQCLGRVLMHAVPSVDHAGLTQLGDEMARTGGRMPHHDDIGCHRLEVAHGVGQGLPLHQARPAGSHVHRVCAEPLLGYLERCACSGTRLEEEIYDGLTAQSRYLLDGPGADLLHRLGGVENQQDLLGG